MHQSVMLEEVVSYLNLKPGYIALDATVGGGGHAVEILNRILPGGILIGLDADASILAMQADALRNYGRSCRLMNENFRNLDKALEAEDIKSLDACLFDVGMSSFQIDDGSRGFSFQHDGPLDMRMDPRLKIRAHDVVNRYREEDIADIIRNFGEDRFAKRIARGIIYARREGAIETTQQLRSIIHRAVGARRGRIDPATRTFQAIRIAVNDELGALEEGLNKGISFLSSGRRIAVISFHSLEDRIVKNTFKRYASRGELRILTKKPLVASDEEMGRNPRARSAKLRVAERA